MPAIERTVLTDCLKASQGEPEAVLVLNTITLLRFAAGVVV